jgi:hypothetical protein
MAVSYSSSSQEAIVLRDSRQTDNSQQTDSSRQTNRQTEQRLPNISSSTAADSSPPRQIAAAPPPKVVTAPSDLIDNNKPGKNIFISPPVSKRKKWDPIKNGKLHTPVYKEDFTHIIPGGLNKLLERQGEQNERRTFWKQLHGPLLASLKAGMHGENGLSDSQKKISYQTNRKKKEGQNCD